MQDCNTRLSRSISAHLREMEAKGLGHEYLISVRSSLFSFKRYCIERGVVAPRSITPEIVKDFLTTYQDHSASHRRSIRCHVRQYLYFADSRAMKDLYMPIRGDDSRRNVSWLSRVEAERLYQLITTPGACSDKQVVLVGAGLLQCCRRIETLRLTYGEVKNALKVKTIRLRAKHKVRAVVLQDEFAQVLEYYLKYHDGKDEDLLIGLKRTRSEELLEEVSAMLDVHLTFHKLRRTGLTLMFEDAGETDRALMQLSAFAGHASIEMTRRYLCLDMKAQKAVVSRYHLFTPPRVPRSDEPVALDDRSAIADVMPDHVIAP